MALSKPYMDLEVPTPNVPITEVPSVPETQPNPEPATTQPNVDELLKNPVPLSKPKMDLEVPTPDVPITKFPSVPETQPNPKPAPTQPKPLPAQGTYEEIKPKP